MQQGHLTPLHQLFNNINLMSPLTIYRNIKKMFFLKKKKKIPVSLIKFSSILQPKWFQLFHLIIIYLNINKLLHKRNMGNFKSLCECFK